MVCAACPDCIFDSTIPEMFEVHVTVNKRDEDRFRALCENNNIKSLSVDFFNNDGILDRHVMTGTVVKNSYAQAVVELTNIVALLIHNGISVERQKIEATETSKTPSLGYFEAHLRYEIQKASKKQFYSALTGRKAKVSFNTKYGQKVPLVTLKSEDTESLKDFKARVKEVETALHKSGFVPSKHFIEHCCLDTNKNYDDVWQFV